jgi:hypothetical protein
MQLHAPLSNTIMWQSTQVSLPQDGPDDDLNVSLYMEVT